MTRNALKPVTAWILFIFSIIFITPTTLTYIPASLYLFMGIPEAPGLILFIPLAGYGLYCSWCITLKMDDYTQFGAPPHIYIGVVAGTIALFMLTKIFGIYRSIHEIIENPFSAIISGYGPLISSYTSLLVIYLMRRNTVSHGKRV
ncbi:hypothetical protein D9M68_670920 [compost metagenome]